MQPLQFLQGILSPLKTHFQQDRAQWRKESLDHQTITLKILNHMQDCQQILKITMDQE